MCYHERPASSLRLLKDMGDDLEGAKLLVDLLNTPGPALAEHREWHVVLDQDTCQVAAVPMLELLDKIQRRATTLTDEQEKFLLAVMWVLQHSDSGLSNTKPMKTYTLRRILKDDEKSSSFRETLKSKKTQPWQRTSRSRRPAAPAFTGKCA